MEGREGEMVVMVVVKGQRFRKLNAYWHARGDRSSVQQRNPSPGVFASAKALLSLRRIVREMRARHYRNTAQLFPGLTRLFDVRFYLRTAKIFLLGVVFTISNARILLSFFKYIHGLYMKLFYSLEFDLKI